MSQWIIPCENHRDMEWQRSASGRSHWQAVTVPSVEWTTQKDKQERSSSIRVTRFHWTMFTLIGIFCFLLCGTTRRPNPAAAVDHSLFGRHRCGILCLWVDWQRENTAQNSLLISVDVKPLRAAHHCCDRMGGPRQATASFTNYFRSMDIFCSKQKMLTEPLEWCWHSQICTGNLPTIEGIICGPSSELRREFDGWQLDKKCHQKLNQSKLADQIIHSKIQIDLSIVAPNTNFSNTRVIDTKKWISSWQIFLRYKHSIWSVLHVVFWAFHFRSSLSWDKSI